MRSDSLKVFSTSKWIRKPDFESGIMLEITATLGVAVIFFRIRAFYSLVLFSPLWRERIVSPERLVWGRRL
jgi:hypothetical protein